MTLDPPSFACLAEIDVEPGDKAATPVKLCLIPSTSHAIRKRGCGQNSVCASTLIILQHTCAYLFNHVIIPKDPAAKFSVIPSAFHR